VGQKGIGRGSVIPQGEICNACGHRVLPATMSGILRLGRRSNDTTALGRDRELGKLAHGRRPEAVEGIQLTSGSTVPAGAAKGIWGYGGGEGYS
jgi:hypothetical protein